MDSRTPLLISNDQTVVIKDRETMSRQLLASFGVNQVEDVATRLGFGHVSVGQRWLLSQDVAVDDAEEIEDAAWETLEGRVLETSEPTLPAALEAMEQSVDEVQCLDAWTVGQILCDALTVEAARARVDALDAIVRTGEAANVTLFDHGHKAKTVADVVVTAMGLDGDAMALVPVLLYAAEKLQIDLGHVCDGVGPGYGLAHFAASHIIEDASHVLRWLQYRGIDLEAPSKHDSTGCLRAVTPLHLAVQVGHYDHVKTLLELGVDPNKHDAPNVAYFIHAPTLRRFPALADPSHVGAPPAALAIANPGLDPTLVAKVLALLTRFGFDGNAEFAIQGQVPFFGNIADAALEREPYGGPISDFVLNYLGLQPTEDICYDDDDDDLPMDDVDVLAPVVEEPVEEPVPAAAETAVVKEPTVLRDTTNHNNDKKPKSLGSAKKVSSASSKNLKHPQKTASTTHSPRPPLTIIVNQN